MTESTDIQAWVGRRNEEQDLLTHGLVTRYRAALDLPPASSGAAPAGIHWCLCLPDAPTAGLGVDGHPARGGFLPPIELPRRMWASSDVEFHAPIVPGARIGRVSTIASVDEKHGRTGRLVFVRVAHDTLADDRLAVRETQTIVYREASRDTGGASPAATPPPPAQSWDMQRTILPTPPLLFRYSALTFNSHRIHYDLPYATGEEGYAGLVVHGPLMASLLLALAEDMGAAGPAPATLARFRFRAQSPAFAGNPLVLAGRREGEKLVLETQDAQGRPHVAAEADLRPA